MNRQPIPSVTKESLNQNLPTGLINPNSTNQTQNEGVKQEQAQTGEVEIFRFPSNNVNKP